MKVFRINDYEWYAAETLDEAIAEAVRMSGLPADEAADDPVEITEKEMDQLTFFDDMSDPESSQTRSFREQLQKMIDDGTKFPAYFAGTEA